MAETEADELQRMGPRGHAALARDSACPAARGSG